ncbi:MAG: MBL fold metallo-hydrolase, partial [Candidatus Omnitrophica bacterium]|nr:MBL fold metallo-hydrolase [Candidatus Omnitrophota bacterium]
METEQNANPRNRLTFLGTGTSSGVPVLGCDCPVCTSTDPRDKRTRISALLETGRSLEEQDYLLIDSSIDLRAQLLREGTPLVTRVAYTHDHVDHFFGLDELRGIQFRTRRPIELYGSPETLNSLRRVYTHLFDETVQKGGGILLVETHPVEERFAAGGFELEPLPI